MKASKKAGRENIEAIKSVKKTAKKTNRTAVAEQGEEKGGEVFKMQIMKGKANMKKKKSLHQQQICAQCRAKNSESVMTLTSPLGARSSTNATSGSPRGLRPTDEKLLHREEAKGSNLEIP